ncbi:MAG: hypothetical protein A2622_04540 [Bdellovibrionales bacterium RIFCSPHIGHO2_01_FULL_40_29]|nr:MAG: hypothetical protein A2622_04540 [Bdellovibrionales bacterium RIFCSPHIGHO2_01_FULL_40_29]OFZ34797.1 MAG: hypothetical protein A3D17_10835 [Bdellovibrionales bacterium RIFCSPHIGHO2_02_FULL_40_15]
MSSKIKSFGIFGICFALGLTLFFSISEEIMIQRDPAAINGKVFQISSLSNDQIKQHLVRKIRVQPTDGGQKSLRLEGFSSAVCKTYANIELTFVADGVAVAGEAPEMRITAPCEAGQDPAEMASILIPIDQIMAEKPRNAEFHFDGFISRFEFKNTSDEWPRTWILKSVSFQSQTQGSKVVQLNHQTSKLNELVVVEF